MNTVPGNTLRPVGTEFTIEYWSSPHHPAERIIVRWRVTAHELGGQGELAEVLSPLEVYRTHWQPIARRVGPQEFK